MYVLPILQMSNYSGNTHTHKSAVIDYDRQFQEDLERAQALSLESLALEKFRLQKEQLDYTGRVRRNYTSQHSKHNTSNNDESNTVEVDGATIGDRYAEILNFAL